MTTRKQPTCSVCGKDIANSPTYITGECQFPLSHAHATIENVKLPGRVASILHRLDSEGKAYPEGLTLQERGLLQNTRIHHNDFTTDFDPEILFPSRGATTPHSSLAGFLSALSQDSSATSLVQ
jgi:hypothetical protein